MAPIKEVQKVEDLEHLGERRSEIDGGVDVDRMTCIADEISAHADTAARTISTANVTSVSKIGEVAGDRASSSNRVRSSSTGTKEAS